MKKIIILMVISFFSCTHKRTASDFIDLGESHIQYGSINAYLEDKKSEVLNDSPWINFMFLNNPYSLNDNNLVSIYVNYHLVYRGVYKKNLVLKGMPSKIFNEKKTIDLTIEILTDRNKKTVWLHRFGNKFSPAWIEDYQIIYCGFFPTNEDVERMYFFPQLKPFLN